MEIEAEFREQPEELLRPRYDLTTLTRFAFRLAFGLLDTGTMFSQTPGREWVRPGYYKQLNPARLQKQVVQMLARDVENPPWSQGVIFAGSSTIAGWDLKHYFAQYRTLNRGIDDSLVSDVAFYVERLVLPFKPPPSCYMRATTISLTG